MNQKPVKKNYIFVCQNDDSGELFAGNQKEIECEINMSEENNQELDFKVIGRIQKPRSLDFPENAIDWYDQEPKDAAFVEKAVFAIIKTLKNGKF